MGWGVGLQGFAHGLAEGMTEGIEKAQDKFDKRLEKSWDIYTELHINELVKHKAAKEEAEKWLHTLTQSGFSLDRAANIALGGADAVKHAQDNAARYLNFNEHGDVNTIAQYAAPDYTAPEWSREKWADKIVGPMTTISYDDVLGPSGSYGSPWTGDIRSAFERRLKDQPPQEAGSQYLDSDFGQITIKPQREINSQFDLAHSAVKDLTLARKSKNKEWIAEAETKHRIAAQTILMLASDPQFMTETGMSEEAIYQEIEGMTASDVKGILQSSLRDGLGVEVDINKDISNFIKGRELDAIGIFENTLRNMSPELSNIYGAGKNVRLADEALLATNSYGHGLQKSLFDAWEKAQLELGKGGVLDKDGLPTPAYQQNYMKEFDSSLTFNGYDDLNEYLKTLVPEEGKHYTLSNVPQWMDTSGLPETAATFVRHKGKVYFSNMFNADQWVRYYPNKNNPYFPKTK